MNGDDKTIFYFRPAHFCVIQMLQYVESFQIMRSLHHAHSIARVIKIH